MFKRLTRREIAEIKRLQDEFINEQNGILIVGTALVFIAGLAAGALAFILN